MAPGPVATAPPFRVRLPLVSTLIGLMVPLFALATYMVPPAMAHQHAAAWLVASALVIGVSVPFVAMEYELTDEFGPEPLEPTSATSRKPSGLKVNANGVSPAEVCTIGAPATPAVTGYTSSLLGPFSVTTRNFPSGVKPTWPGFGWAV